MSDLVLIQDLLAHAHEAPAPCAALMRRAARALGGQAEIIGEAPAAVAINERLLGPAQVKGAPCS